MSQDPPSAAERRPTWPHECGIRPAAGWSMCAEARLDGAAGGVVRPAQPGRGRLLSNPADECRFVQPGWTNAAFVQLRAGVLKRPDGVPEPHFRTSGPL